ncbi:hypothetical protein CEXT_796631 [Caerostris extrusa]|uniref:Uncharacterized protein n=1 Tax=Caerostris extrusa TaxID=172846 RepID=A0AAV4WPQ1_CAEEX|nr:hypothetical protein CEXT_796631 [Caerostris extrusa]
MKNLNYPIAAFKLIPSFNLYLTHPRERESIFPSMLLNFKTKFQKRILPPLPTNFSVSLLTSNEECFLHIMNSMKLPLSEGYHVSESNDLFTQSPPLFLCKYQLKSGLPCTNECNNVPGQRE